MFTRDRLSVVIGSVLTQKLCFQGYLNSLLLSWGTWGDHIWSVSGSTRHCTYALHSHQHDFCKSSARSYAHVFKLTRLRETSHASGHFCDTNTGTEATAEEREEDDDVQSEYGVIPIVSTRSGRRSVRSKNCSAHVFCNVH